MLIRDTAVPSSIGAVASSTPKPFLPNMKGDIQHISLLGRCQAAFGMGLKDLHAKSTVHELTWVLYMVCDACST